MITTITIEASGAEIKVALTQEKDISISVSDGEVFLSKTEALALTSIVELIVYQENEE